MNVHEAIINKQTWKSPIIDAYARALLVAARNLLLFRRVRCFNNDDVPEESQPGDKTTVGATIKLLMTAGIIEPYYGHHPEDGIYGGRRRSSRECNNGHKNQLYQLTSLKIVDTWLARHGGASDQTQTELFAMPAERRA